MAKGRSNICLDNAQFKFLFEQFFILEPFMEILIRKQHIIFYIVKRYLLTCIEFLCASVLTCRNVPLTLIINV